MDSPSSIQLPPDDIGWVKNDSRHWPKVTYEDLVDYLLTSKAYDGKEMKSFRALYGYNYVQNGWMGDILSVCLENVHYLKATVSPSQPGVGKKDYSTWIAVGNDCSILTGLCSCPAGQARSCSHIAAVIYAVTLAWTHGVGGATCTDKPVAWGKGSAKSLTHEKLTDIDFNRPKQGAVPIIVEKAQCKPTNNLPKIPQFLDHSDLKEYVLKSSVKPLWECKGTMLYKVLNAPERTVQEVTNLTHTVHSVDSSKPVPYPACAACQQFFDSCVNFSSDKISEIKHTTVNQNSPLWMDSRKLRLTSSRVNAVPKSERADPNRFVNNHVYTRFKGCAATRHGQKFEPVAREWFEQETGVKVQKCGICIKSDEPYVAASPDGMVDCNTILEIKCPTKNLDELLASGKYDVILKDNVPHLNPKGKNGYYSQVQITMYCTDTTVCKFVVWTQDKSIILDVAYDKDYVSGILPRVRHFYFKHLLVRLADEHHAKRLKLSREYKSFCS